MTSRLNLAAPAIRPSLPARAVFSGPPGSGKTRTALIVATVLAEGAPILFIDTEQESALTYADDFEFQHLPFRPPYDPRDLAATLMEAGDTYAVIVVDSLSHFWRGEGGVLDTAGGKFSNWKDARPIHETMVQAFLNCRAHFIGCARSKVEHVQEVDPRSGKQVVRKLGMAVIQDDSLEYELNVACEIDMDHSFIVSKSRTVAVPVGRVFKAEQAEKFAEEYRDWLRGGEPPAPGEFVADIITRIGALPDQTRKECKAAFMAALGRPDTLPESRMAAAEALVARFEAGGGGSDVPPDGGVPTAPPPPAPSSGGGAATVPPPVAPTPGDIEPGGGVSPEPEAHEPEAPALSGPVSSGGETPQPAPAALPPDVTTYALETALLKAAARPTIPQAKTAVLRLAATGHGHQGTWDDLLADEGLAAAVLADLGGELPTETAEEAAPLDLTPWKELDPKAWDTWRKRCNAMAGPGTKAKPHPRILDEDKTIYDEQRHALAYGASRKTRGEGNEVTSWNHLTEQECRMILRTLEMLGEGFGFLTFGDTGSPGGWIVERKETAA